MITYKYGIDFGTTNSSIAIVMEEDGRKAVKVLDVSRETPQKIIRSSVSFSSKGVEVVDGTLPDSATIIDTVKSSLRRDEKDCALLSFQGEEYFYSDIMAVILKRLRIEAEKQIGNLRPDGVVMGIPNQTLEAVKDVYYSALYKAGFYQSVEEARKKTEFLEESVAVALHYGQKEELQDKRALVFDFGGGTLDLAIVDLKRQSLNDENPINHEIYSKGGVSGIAGEKWTRTMFLKCFVPNYALKYYNRNQTELKKLFLSFGIDENECTDFASIWRALNDTAWGTEFKREIEKTKILLTQRKKVLISFRREANAEHNEILIRPIEVMRDEFEAAINGDITEIEGAIDELLNLSDRPCKKSEIDEVLLAGGSSAIPSVQEMLIKKFGKEKVYFDDTLDGSFFTNAMTATASGFAYAGYSNLIWEDVTSFDYGYYDDLKRGVNVIIPQNTRYLDTKVNLAKRRGQFYEDIEQVDPNAKGFRLEIYEGGSKLETLNFTKYRHSGEYRLFFSMDARKGTLVIDVLDTGKEEWVQDLSKRERSIRVKK